MKLNEKNRKILKLILCILLIGIMELLFFSNVLPINNLIGDSSDARLNNMIVEHWYQVFCGNEKISEMMIFYPTKNILSYTDIMFAFSLPYSLFRLFGMDIFLANKMVLILVHFAGSLGMFYFLRKKLKIDTYSSMIGVVLFSFSSAYHVASGHTQLFGLSFVIFFVIFLYDFLENINNKKKRIKYFALTLISFELLLYTSFYIAYFTFLFVLFVVMALLLVWRKSFKNIIVFMVSNVKEMFLYLVGMIVINIPFLILYMPTSKLFGTRAWSLISFYLPKPVDFINVSTDNIIWGNLIEKIGQVERGSQVEFAEGFPIITFMLFLTVSFLFIIKFIKSKKNKGQPLEINKMIVVVLAIAVLFSFLILVNIPMYIPGKGNRTVALWYILYRVLPGCAAMRAVVRYNMFLTLPVSIVIAVGISQWAKGRLDKKSWKVGIILSFLCAFLFVENFSIPSVYSEWKRNQQLELLEQVTEPPSDCEIMFLVDSVSEENDYMTAQMDAWVIADKFGIVTLNGYSGQFPEGWNELFWRVNDDDAVEKASIWIEEYQLNNVYYYDRGMNTWIKYN